MAFNFEKALQDGWTPQDINSYLASKGRQKEVNDYFGTNIEQKEVSFLSGVRSDLRAEAEELRPSFERLARGEQTFGETLFQTGAAGAELGFDILSRGVSAVLPDFVKDTATKAGLRFLETPLGNKALEAASKGLEVYNQFKKENPRAAANIEAVIDIAGFIPLVRSGTALTRAGIRGIGALAKKLPTTIESFPTATAVTETALPSTQTARGVVTGLKETAKDIFERGKKALVESAQEAERLKSLPEPVSTAIKTGISEPFINLVKTASPEDRGLFKQMFDIAKKRAGDLRVMEQAKEIPGQTYLKLVEYLINKRKEFGKAIGNVVQKIGDKIAQSEKLYGEFLIELKKWGLDVDSKGKVINLGKLPDEDLPAIQKMVNFLRTKGSKTFRELDAERGKIFNTLNLAKSRQQAFSEMVDSIAESYRRILSNPLGSEYRDLSKKFAETIGVLKENVKLLGYKGSLEDLLLKDLRVGEVALRVLGNAADRPLSVIVDTLETAKKYGFKATNDLFDQLRFVDELEDIFGTTSRSLGGQIGRAGTRALREGIGAFTDIAQGRPTGLIGRLGGALSEATQKEKIDALEKLLEFISK